MNEFSPRRLREIKILVMNECSNYHFSQGCFYVECAVEKQTHPSKQCCFMCDTADCKSYRQCRFFDKIVLPLETRAKIKKEKEKEVKQKIREWKEGSHIKKPLEIKNEEESGNKE